MNSLQLWGGIECTVLRAGGEWRDQLLDTGHHDRETDLDLVASLGIRKLRYPVLWERVAPESLDRLDWSNISQSLTVSRQEESLRQLFDKGGVQVGGSSNRKRDGQSPFAFKRL